MQAAINDLHFHPRWFEYGFLPLDFFERQVAMYRNTSDPSWGNVEHHRYLAFKTVLSSHEKLTDEQVERYIDLCRLDEDQAMAQTALIDLLEGQGLTNDQYHRLTHHPAYGGPVAQKIIWRNRMQAELQAESVSEVVFTEVMARGDSVFERTLVCAPGLSRQQLEVLAKEGRSRTIRNMATNRLGRRAPGKSVTNHSSPHPYL